MKKLNKLFAILVAMAMVLSLGVVSAFAADATPEQQADNAYITKNFQMPVGTTNPGTKFYFTIKADTTNGDATAVDLYGDNNPLEIDMSSGTTTSTNNETGVVTLTKQVKDAFANVPTKAGKYVYTVREINDPTDETNGNKVATDTTTADYTYSTDWYTVIAYREANGSLKFTAQKNQNNGTGKVPAQQDGDKTYVDCAFTNEYVEIKATTPDGKEPDGNNDSKGFYIQKKVDGAQADTSLPFKFNVTVSKPTLSNATAYHAQIVTMKEDGSGYTGTPVDVTFTLATETAAATETTPATTAGACTQEVSLSHNQRLVFTDLDVGANVSVTEPAVEDWTTKVNGDQNNTYSGAVTSDSNLKAAYVNTYTKGDSTPEGILISNLPYIALALVAIGGLVAYVVVRRRNADEA